jgi:peptidoglycan lytic transglycosylase G
LRPSPPFVGSTKGTLIPSSPNSALGTAGLDDAAMPSAAMAKLATPLFGGSKDASAGKGTSDAPAPAGVRGAAAPNPAHATRAKADLVKAEIAKSDAANSDWRNPERPVSGKTGAGLPATGRAPANTGASIPVGPGRVALGGEPEPFISGRPIDGLGGSLMEQKRITPRSPRAALQPEHVPPPAPQPIRPSRRARNPLVIVGNAIFTLLILALVAGGGAVVFGKSRFEAPGPLQEDKLVTIPPRSGMMDIADLLQREGVIDEHRIIFAGGVFALKARSGLKAGEYLFQKHASVRDVVETIVEGKVVQHQLTIPEGLTSEQIVARLLETDLLAGNIKDVPREGSLLPDGYHFHRGFSREQLIQRMRHAQDRLVREAWERRNPDLPLKTPDQLVILASIIEKETGKPEERTRVAAVFVNRLKQKMKLQSDPTIVYGLVFGKGSLGRPITKADIQSQTPYNTYVIEGLPPGPISNPGRASIEAAANPARTKELFFVADGTGGHAFAETYDQHLKNVAKLRAVEHEARGESATPATEAPPAAAAPARPAPPTPHRGRRNVPRSAGAQ